MMKKPQHVGSENMARGSWLSLDVIHYRDETGKRRRYETASRLRQQGTVMMITLLLPSERYLFVEQYRPPLDRYVLEFPAGLIDDGEAPEETALRELKEETGYSGKIEWISAPTFNSPGMSAESAIQVVMTVPEDAPENLHPMPQADDGEHLQVYRVPKTQITAFLRQKSEDDRVVLDSKVLAYFLGQGCLFYS